MFDGMDHYLRNKPGKAFHDPLAACAAIEPGVCRYRSVKLYREKGDWGSRLDPAGEASCRIAVSVDRPAFERVLSGVP